MAAPAFVQSATAAASALPPLTCTFAAPSTAGNILIVVAAAHNSTANITVTDDKGNTYQRGPHVATPDGSYSAQLWYCPNAIGGVLNVTTNQDGGGSSEVFAYEFSAPVALEGSTVSAGGGNVEDSGPLNNFRADDLLFGFMAGTGANTPVSGTGWTGPVVSGSGICIAGEYQIPGVSGSFDATFSSTASKGGTNFWACGIVAFSTQANVIKPSLTMVGVGM